MPSVDGSAAVDGASSAAAALRERMAELTGTDASDWYLVTKARQGMQVVLDAAREATKRSEVITQLFTCVTAINPILAADLTPRYVDISAHTLAVDPALAQASQHTCAVVLQRTFGIEDDATSQRLREMARQSGALLLEDSAHCVGRMAKDERGRPVADVSIHSFGVEKMLFGTYFGGAVWVNPAIESARVGHAIRDALLALPPVDAQLDRATRKYRNQVRMLTRLPGKASQALRARWEQKGTMEPAVSDVERRGLVNHEPSAPSSWVCEQALAALADLAANEESRSSCVRAYLRAFDERDRAELGIPRAVVDAPNQPLLRFPVFVDGERQADAVVDGLAQAGLYAPKWPRPLLVPGVLDAGAYGLARGADAWPVSQRLSASIVCLPTDIDPVRVDDVVRVLQETR